MIQRDDLNVPLCDLINCMTNTIDLVSPVLADHHNRVGVIAYALGNQMGLSEEERIDLHFAGNLHDIGALSLTDRVRLLTFDGCETFQHEETGALLLEMFEPLAHLGQLVRFHHARWEDGAGEVRGGSEVPLGSHILHLADRISVLIGALDGINLLTRVPDIRKKIKKASGRMFAPTLVEAFNDLSVRESFWLGIAFPGHNRAFERRTHVRSFTLDTEGILGLSRMFARIIDFRSRFTATHSCGVAASAEALARLSGRSVADCAQMRIAGLLHDLGKLAVPAELLEKPADLSEAERAVIRSHTYFTRRALENISAFDTITSWGADHHERVDGKGYPYHVGGDNLSNGSRIMAVSDVFTAITEDRPYRAGMDRSAAQKVLKSMADHSALDHDIVEILMANYDELNATRAIAQSEAVAEYREICGKVTRLTAGRAAARA
jgi:HD-GYP domain-containing protein (c-di-GMP phosphodiesterase class II)